MAVAGEEEAAALSADIVPQGVGGIGRGAVAPGDGAGIDLSRSVSSSVGQSAGLWHRMSAVQVRSHTPWVLSSVGRAAD